MTERARFAARRRGLHGRRLPCRHLAEPLEQRLLLATISGTKFNDADGNGRRDLLVDTGLGNWTIYADLNNNGTPDAGEPSDVTDGRGGYSLTVSVLRATAVHVREIGQANWRVSFPA